MLRRRGSLSAALWCLWGSLRRGPGVLGLAAEDRLRLGALERPVAPVDLGLKLTRCPAGVADEDPQTVHGLVAAKQLEQQLPVRAQVDAVTGLDILPLGAVVRLSNDLKAGSTFGRSGKYLWYRLTGAPDGTYKCPRSYQH